eukprot:TRINITY_DN6394_c0_g1_i1.p1 TRINITY_DN6394_c0_g1~~TRINITY_DN6394_c0_g1_i1.p1  ORF type:complete len:123 (-),score=24.30 TRINITY_DN6394_c0_g1_i1:283-651(-)
MPHLVTEKIRESGCDAGCSYNQVFCANCNAKVGKIYRSTVPNLDYVREAFTFSLNETCLTFLPKTSTEDLDIKMDSSQILSYLDKEKKRRANLESLARILAIKLSELGKLNERVEQLEKTKM